MSRPTALPLAAVLEPAVIQCMEI